MLDTLAHWRTGRGVQGGGKKVCFGNGKDTADPAEMNFNESAEYKQTWSVAGVYRGLPLPVGSFAPNALGLYDMSGNAQAREGIAIGDWEWCWDWYGDYPAESQVNPSGASSGSVRVSRGGCWGNPPEFERAYDRGSKLSRAYDKYHTIGFRLVRSTL